MNDYQRDWRRRHHDSRKDVADIYRRFRSQGAGGRIFARLMWRRNKDLERKLHDWYWGDLLKGIVS